MTEAQGRLEAMVAELWLHRKNSNECGPGGLEGLGVNRGVFQVPGDRAELPGQQTRRGVPRRSYNGRRTSVGGGGALWSRVQSEREGEGV
jgi:hypothetical protein